MNKEDEILKRLSNIEQLLATFFKHTIMTPTLDQPLCVTCGNIMMRNGSCHMCDNCGSTSGCS